MGIRAASSRVSALLFVERSLDLDLSLNGAAVPEADDDDAAGKPKCCLCLSIAALSSDNSSIYGG